MFQCVSESITNIYTSKRSTPLKCISIKVLAWHQCAAITRTLTYLFIGQFLICSSSCVAFYNRRKNDISLWIIVLVLFCFVHLCCFIQYILNICAEFVLCVFLLAVVIDFSSEKKLNKYQ